MILALLLRRKPHRRLLNNCLMLRPFGGRAHSLATASSGPTPAEAAAAQSKRLWREYLWTRLARRVVIFFDLLWHQNKVEHLFGKRVYDRLFGMQIPPAPAETNQKIRFINGEVVGRQLERGKGPKDLARATVDPAICAHPTPAMKRRGNTPSNKWWLCQQCASRFERYPASSVTRLGETEPPRHQDLVTFGKHTGETYQQTLEDAEYCNWILLTVDTGDSNPSLNRLAHYIHAQQLQETYLADPMEEEGDDL